MREAQACNIPKLLEKNIRVNVVDPQGKKEGKHLLMGVNLYDSPYDAVKNTDCLVIMTEWDQFRALNLSKISSSMKIANMVDLRNVYSKELASAGGFAKYVAVGQ